MLRDHRFKDTGIIDNGFKEIPPLWVDQKMFQQVFFNLLVNAVKYAHEAPEAFSITIDGFETPAGYEIRFRDRGMGIRRAGRRRSSGKRCAPLRRKNATLWGTAWASGWFERSSKPTTVQYGSAMTSNPRSSPFGFRSN